MAGLDPISQARVLRIEKRLRAVEDAVLSQSDLVRAFVSGDLRNASIYTKRLKTAAGRIRALRTGLS